MFLDFSASSVLTAIHFPSQQVQFLPHYASLSSQYSSHCSTPHTTATTAAHRSTLHSTATTVPTAVHFITQQQQYPPQYTSLHSNNSSHRNILHSTTTFPTTVNVTPQPPLFPFEYTFLHSKYSSHYSTVQLPFQPVQFPL